MLIRSAVALGASAVVAAAIGVTSGSAQAATHAASPERAAVTQAARHGGYVIITMRKQFPHLLVRADGARRTAATEHSQRGVVSQIQAHGGSHVRSLISVNAVAAKVPAGEVARLRNDPSVASVQRDATVVVPHAAVPSSDVSDKLCPANPKKPLQEPEALALTHFRSQPAKASDAARIATGKGVKVGLTGINALAGNPNLIRPNGQHVVIDSPTPNADDSDFDGGGDEWYGDASAIAGQGTVTYDFSKELPYSSLPAGCTFRIDGIAPSVSLVDTGYFGQGTSTSAGDTPARESQAIAGLDHAAIDEGVSVVSESYGYGAIPGQTDFSAITQANDALVAAGITVVESAGDSGVGGTVEVPAYDPKVIDAGASTSLRLLAQAWGYKGWENDQMAPLSSAGTTPDNNVVDLVAPGLAGEASCSPKSATCPQTTLTEAFGGTSQSAPFIAGAAADVIQAYADSHHGTRPAPALVKQILTGTASDIGAASDSQGAGLLDVGAAVRAAQQLPGSTTSTTSTTRSGSAALLPTPGQVHVRGAGGSRSTHRVTLYNASSHAATVHATVRRYGADHQIGHTVTEHVTAPPASQHLPAEGATAARQITMRVPDGLAHLGVDMITPNPKNDAVLSLLLFDPKGRLSQVSYDYSANPTGPVSNNEHVGIDHPMPGRWTAKVVWNNGRAHLQDPPPKPGAYRGTISVRFTGNHAQTERIGGATRIGAHRSASVAVPVTLPSTPGDAPESVQFSGSNGAATSVPITRRTLVPAGGGRFTATLGSSVARDLGPLKSFQVQVPKGKKNLRVTFHTADTSADNIIDYFLIAPNGIDGYYDSTPSTTPQGAGAAGQRGNAALVVANPPAGLWTVQVLLELTTSGKEFDQQVHGALAYNTSRVRAYDVPDSASTKLAKGKPDAVSVGVTNTTGVGRDFSLSGSAGDVSGKDTYIPAGATVLVPATVTPKAASGSVVTGTLTVVSDGSALTPLLTSEEFTFDQQSVATIPYEYTVAASSSGS